MKCIDCWTNVIGNIPNHLYDSGRCRKCHKIYETKQSFIAEAKQVEEEAKKIIEEKRKEEEPELEKELERFDMMDFD